MADFPLSPSSETAEQVPAALPEPKTELPDKKSNVGIIIGVVVLLLIMVGLVVFLFAQDISTTSKIRDVFLIFLALQTFVIGIVLIILVVQITLLINLVRNEIKPAIDSTNQTVNTLRGTATFLSNNLTSPVIKANTFFAAIRRFFQLVFPRRTGK
jgi:nitrate reductase gamma subunit